MRRAGFFTAVATRSSLWLGKDHLLCIDSNGYGEDYKRFYFRDIQGLTMRRTRRRFWWTIVLLASGLLALAVALFVRSMTGDVGANIFWGVIAALLGIPLIINLARGPTCVCHLHTAVQVEELPSLKRFRRARKVLDRLRPLIAGAQGQLAPEQIPARMQELVSRQSAGYVADDPNAPPRIIS